MTPNSKAKDLIATFRPYSFYSESGNHQKNADNQKESAKKCAVKSEDDLLESIDSMDDASRIFVDKSMAIGNRIVEVMEMKGLKQKDLAQLMDKTEAEVSRMLGGMHNLTLRMIAKIEAALEYDIICIPEAK